MSATTDPKPVGGTTPFVRTVAQGRCIEPGHHNSKVVGNGTYERGGIDYQAYRCTPRVGDRHSFSVRIDGEPTVRRQAGAPACAKHAGSHVVRFGRYGRKSLRRQRYQCRHERCNDLCRPTCKGRHTFTPALPRSHVCRGEHCSTCREPLSLHRGRQAVARGHGCPVDVVARALDAMSAHASYARAGRDALEAIGIDLTCRRRAAPSDPPAPRRRWSRRARRARSAASRNWGRFWQVGAGFVEAFGPVIWRAAEERLRERAAAIALAGQPRVWVLDEIPIYALDQGGKRKKSDGWVVLVLAEMDWTDREVPGRTKLRLVRAMPKANSTAWRLAFAEVGYTPDLIVSDAATSIVAAVGRHFDGPDAPLLVPSVWHLGRALENNALEKALRTPTGRALRTHLAELKRDGGALRSPAVWSDWWDELARLARASGAVKLDALRQTRANYEARMARAIPRLVADPRLVISTGGLESIIRDTIEPVLERRRHQFANIERTNHLMDLVVARAVGMFSDLRVVEDLLIADAEEHAGWTVPLRTIADPQPSVGVYRSLRDEMLLLAVAEQRGLAA